jgi:hypothetical protein
MSIQVPEDIESKASVEAPLGRCIWLQTYKPCHSMALPCAAQFYIDDRHFSSAASALGACRNAQMRKVVSSLILISLRTCVILLRRQYGKTVSDE